MGSGRGRARRVNIRYGPTTTGALDGPLIPDAASCDLEIWRNYVQQNNFARRTLSQHYLGKKINASNLNHQDIVKVVHELFLDLVSMGALQLPAGRTPDEYDFVLKNGITPWNRNSIPHIVLVDRGKQEERWITNDVSSVVKVGTKMDDRRVGRVVGNIVSGINVLNDPSVYGRVNP
jgi:hypothetical protein